MPYIQKVGVRSTHGERRAGQADRDANTTKDNAQETQKGGHDWCLRALNTLAALESTSVALACIGRGGCGDSKKSDGGENSEFSGEHCERCESVSVGYCRGFRLMNQLGTKRCGIYTIFLSPFS